MKVPTLCLLFLTSLPLLGQTKILEQRKQFEAKKRAALVEIEREHLEALREIRDKYRSQLDEGLAEMAAKEASEFLDQKFHEDLVGSTWGPKEGGSKMEFTVDRGVECFAPASWFKGQYQIIGLTKIQFEAKGFTWVMDFNFAKGTAVCEKQAGKGIKPVTYNLIRKD